MEHARNIGVLFLAVVVAVFSSGLSITKYGCVHSGEVSTEFYNVSGQCVNTSVARCESTPATIIGCCASNDGPEAGHNCSESHSSAQCGQTDDFGNEPECAYSCCFSETHWFQLAPVSQIVKDGGVKNSVLRICYGLADVQLWSFCSLKFVVSVSGPPEAKENPALFPGGRGLRIRHQNFRL